MDKFDGLTIDFIEPRGYQLAGTWRRYRQIADVRRRVQRCERRLDEVFRKFIEMSARRGNSYRFEIEFASTPAPWRTRSQTFDGRLVHDLHIYVPRVVQFLTDELGLESTLRRWLAAAIEVEFPELPAVQALREPAPAVPLRALGCIPCAGRAGRWHRDPDVDAYARAASVLCDLARPVLVGRLDYSSWPVLELMPAKNVVQVESCQWTRAYLAPVAGASLLAPYKLADRVASDFQTALRLRSLEDHRDLDDLSTVLRDSWRQANYALSLRTSTLRRSGHNQRLRVEFESRPWGSMIRPVVENEGGLKYGDWQETNGGSEEFLDLEPGVGYSWLPDGRIRLVMPTINPSRQIVDLNSSEDRAVELALNSSDDCWSALELAREAARDASVPAVGQSLYATLARISPTSLKEFALSWAAWDRALAGPPVLSAASEVLGYVSPDVFEDLRGWIILNGIDMFNKIVASPSVLLGQQFEGLDQVEEVVANLHVLYREALGSDFLEHVLEESVELSEGGSQESGVDMAGFNQDGHLI